MRSNLDGVAELEEDLALAYGLRRGHHDHDDTKDRGFPSTGFGTVGNSNGAFLARRGD